MKGAVISTCFSLSPLYVYIYFFLYKTSLSVLKKEGLEYHLSHISTVDRQIQSLIHHIFLFDNFYSITKIITLLLLFGTFPHGKGDRTGIHQSNEYRCAEQACSNHMLTPSWIKSHQKISQHRVHSRRRPTRLNGSVLGISSSVNGVSCSRVNPEIHNVESMCGRVGGNERSVTTVSCENISKYVPYIFS